jgi:uncharacterized membrane protein
MRCAVRVQTTAVVAAVLVTITGLAVLRPEGLPGRPAGLEDPTEHLVDARLLDVASLSGEPGDEGAIMVTARLAGSGEVVTFLDRDPTGERWRGGQRVRLTQLTPADARRSYALHDVRRGRPLALLALLFVTAVVAVGRWTGARALAGMALSAAMIGLFVLPALVAGRPPLPVALVGAATVLLLTLYLAHGWSPKTTAAVVGTLGALALTGALAWAFVHAARLSGFGEVTYRFASLDVGILDLRGLLLAGIVIGVLGVLDDVAIAQSSTIFELRQVQPEAGFATLLRAGLRVGRDHAAAAVSTLALAYVGAGLPLLVWFSSRQAAIAQVATAEVVAVEVVRTLVGSIGLIAAVPLTSALAAWSAVQCDPQSTRRISNVT